MESEVVLTLARMGRREADAEGRVDEGLAPMIYVAISEQLSGDLGGEAVILSLKTGKYYGLNVLGARIWELLQVPRSLESIEGIILDEFDVEPTECYREVTAFINLLKSEGLIERIDSDASEISPPAKDGKGTNS